MNDSSLNKKIKLVAVRVKSATANLTNKMYTWQNIYNKIIYIRKTRNISQIYYRDYREFRQRVYFVSLGKNKLQGGMVDKIKI